MFGGAQQVSGGDRVGARNAHLVRQGGGVGRDLVETGYRAQRCQSDTVRRGC